MVERQRAAVRTRIGAGMTAEAAFDADRWDRELGDDFAGLALTMAPELAAPISAAFGVEFDLPFAEAWLLKNARLAAAAYNARTRVLLADASAAAIEDAATPAGMTARSASTKTPRSAMRAQADDVFDEAAGPRAAYNAQERAAIIANYTSHEAARQAGARSKTWSTGPNARPSHQALNGLTIPADETFPNGLRYPHDVRGPVGERAGCNCHLSYSTTDVDPDVLDDARSSAPGGMRDTNDFDRWAGRRRLDSDLGYMPELTQAEADDLNTIAATIDDLVGRYKWVMPDDPGDLESWGFRGIYTERAGPGTINARARAGILDSDALVEAGAQSTERGAHAGAYIVVNSRSLGTFGDNLYAQIGYVGGKDARTVIIHEFGHVIAKTIGNAPGVAFRGQDAFESFVGSVINDVYGSATTRYSARRLLMRDITGYAGQNNAEAWAELFLFANDPELFASMPSNAARARLRTFCRTLNERFREWRIHGPAADAGIPDIIPVP